MTMKKVLSFWLANIDVNQKVGIRKSAINSLFIKLVALSFFSTSCKKSELETNSQNNTNPVISKSGRIYNHVADQSFGLSCALAKNSLTAVVSGSIDDPSETGETHVFEKNGSTWVLSGSLIGNTPLADPRAMIGQSAALDISDDGNTIIVGGTGDEIFTGGSVFIFSRSGTGWNQELFLTRDSASYYRDYEIICKTQQSVSISGDGNTAIVHGIFNGYNHAFLYKKNAGIWNNISKIRIDSLDQNIQVQALDLSYDGSTIVISKIKPQYIISNIDYLGYIDIYHYSTGLVKQSSYMTPPGISNVNFGNSISLSSDGNRLLITKFGIENGDVYDFKRNFGQWYSYGSIIPDSIRSQIRSIGSSISVSGDGERIFYDGELRNTGQTLITAKKALVQHDSQTNSIIIDQVSNETENTDSPIVPIHVTSNFDGKLILIGNAGSFSANFTSVGYINFFYLR